MNFDADSVLERAKDNGYTSVDPGQLEVIIAQLTCDLVQALTAEVP